MCCKSRFIGFSPFRRNIQNKEDIRVTLSLGCFLNSIHYTYTHGIMQYPVGCIQNPC